MSQITIPLLYLLASLTFAMNRLPRFAPRARLLLVGAVASGWLGFAWHAWSFHAVVIRSQGLDLSIASAISLIGLVLALIGLLGAIEATLRGMSASLLGLAAIASVAVIARPPLGAVEPMTWQMQGHILIALVSYCLLTAGAIVAIHALLLDRRLRSGRFATANPLFAPLETTEKLLFAITATGFGGLLLTVVTGLAFVEDLFGQHLVHKSALSLLALVLFGVLLAGRLFTGWRGRRAVSLYLGGFGILCLAYFGSRVILEVVLGRSWG